MKNRRKRLAAALLAAFLTAGAAGMPVSAGWHHSGNGWQYRHGENGEYCRSGWQMVDGCWYCFDGQGMMRTGWIHDNGCWYYCDASGAMKTGWVCHNNCWYYCNTSGVMQTGWVKVGNSWYFCDQNGVMQTGILQIDGVRYSFDDSGAMTGTGVPGYAKAAYNGDGSAAALVDPVKDGTTVRVTIPEGKNAAEIAVILEQNGVCRREDFLRAINAYQTTSETFDGWKDNAALFYEYEGCLFPDTYEFYRYEDPQTVIRRLLINCDEKLTDEWKAAAEAKGLTIVEAVTLASVIQEEAASPADMAKVSAVFWNRLENPGVYPKLQSNPTKEYANNVILPNRQLGNPAVDPASYATCQTTGLPAGPICNPGMDALWAAVRPDESCSATFFCTDKNGTFYFADTYAEHLTNVETANSVNAALSSQG